MAEDASPGQIERSIASLRRQSRADWELRAVVDAGRNPAAARGLERAEAGDPRVGVENGVAGDPGASYSAALTSATGAWVSVLLPGDEFASRTVEILGRAGADGEPFDMLYGDEATIGTLGIPSPRELPDWSPALYEGHDYLDLRVFLRAERLREAGGFRPGCGEAFAYEALLRATEVIAPGRVRHLPEVLRFRRVVPVPGALAPGASASGDFRRALEEHLARVRPGARVEPVAACPSLRRVVDPLPSPCRVAVIVPIRDRDDLLRSCMRSVLGELLPVEVEPVVVDNGSTDPPTLRLLDELAAERGVRVLRRPEPFNFSALCNAGAAAATARLFCFLNNDVAARDPGWLAELARLASIADVGAAGPLLRYPDGRLQHLGIRVEHPFPRLLGDLASEEELRDRPARHVVHEVAAVTGGCLVTRRDVFERVGGFDEELAVAYNDVD
ncbi:glycosyltransferase, partial [bacterium]|nr:glycosyltransferase [bacterium]